MSDHMPTALVTGYANGMGKAVAERFLNEGWGLVGLDLNESPPADLASHPALVHCTADITDRNTLGTTLTEALGGKASLSCVVTAAGVYPPTTIESASNETYRSTFDINVLGTVQTIQAALPYLRRAPQGRSIVTFASADAFVNSPGQLLYSASKAAVVALTRSLAVELAPDGISVNGVAPGWVRTPGTESNARMRQAAASIPVGRVAEPDEIADWVWRLGHGHGGYLTGETLIISGGSALR